MPRAAVTDSCCSLCPPLSFVHDAMGTCSILLSCWKAKSIEVVQFCVPDQNREETTTKRRRLASAGRLLLGVITAMSLVSV